MKVLFIGDRSWYSRLAGVALESRLDVVACNLDAGSALPSEVLDWRGDLIVSFKSDTLLPEEILQKATRAAINFHPAPPYFRGLGGYFHAQREQESFYGVTAHHMDRKVDHGPIIDVYWFDQRAPFQADELYHLAGAHCLVQLVRVVRQFCVIGDPGLSGHQWAGPLHLRKELTAEECASMAEFERSRPSREALRIVQASNILGTNDSPFLDMIDASPSRPDGRLVGV